METSYQSLNVHDSGAAEKARELQNKSFEKTGKKTIIYRGRECKQTTYEKRSGTLGRIVRGAAAALTVIPTPLTFLNLSEDFRNATWKPALDGSVKESIYEETDKEENINETVVGCNPKKSASVQSFLEGKRPEWREANGHNFLVGKGRKGISFFYFIPNGDVTKAHSVKFWTAKNGKSIMNATKQLRAIRSYCASFEDIENKWEQEIPRLATSLMGVRSGLSEVDAKAAIRRQPRTIVIDSQAGLARVYGPYDPNKVNPDSHRTGTSITLEKETIDEINRVNGKSMEHKEPLAGERPFKTPPSNPLEGLYPPGKAPSRSNTPHVGNINDSESEWSAFSDSDSD